MDQNERGGGYRQYRRAESCSFGPLTGRGLESSAHLRNHAKILIDGQKATPFLYVLALSANQALAGPPFACSVSLWYCCAEPGEPSNLAFGRSAGCPPHTSPLVAPPTGEKGHHGGRNFAARRAAQPAGGTAGLGPLSPALTLRCDLLPYASPCGRRDAGPCPGGCTCGSIPGVGGGGCCRTAAGIGKGTVGHHASDTTSTQRHP